jgi:hypothetical protein
VRTTHERQEQHAHEILNLLRQTTTNLPRNDQPDDERSKDGVDTDSIRDEATGESEHHNGANDTLRRSLFSKGSRTAAHEDEEGFEDEEEHEDPGEGGEEDIEHDDGGAGIDQGDGEGEEYPSAANVTSVKFRET